MSGECDKCGEHCLDCKCNSENYSSFAPDPNPIAPPEPFIININLNEFAEYKQLVKRIEELENQVKEILKTGDTK